jgi:hypothetical protein
MRKRPKTLTLLEALESRHLLSTTLQTYSLDTSTSTTVQSVAALTPTYEAYVPDGSLTPLQTSGPEGYTPAEIRAAYGMNQVTFGSVAGDGSGQTIAIIDAYNDPTIKADLAGFDAAFDLPSTTLTVVSQTGSTTALPPVDPAGAGNDNFEGEEALDVEWAHAMAPGATIMLVEAQNASPSNLFAAVNFARQQAGVSVVSMSFGGNETSSETQYDADFTTPSGHQGVTFVASTGDSGEPGGYPAFSPNVVATGGTSLSIDSLGNYQSETGWTDSGGGVSTVESQPSYQTGIVTQSSTRRATPDVAFDADPDTGVAVYDSYNNGTSTPWEILGGTSVAAPAWSGILAVADQGRVIAGESTLDSRTQTLPLLYSAPAADYHDITTGNNGFAAGTGYDLVTGRGSPQVNLLIPYLVTGVSTVTTPPVTTPPVTTTGPTLTSISANALTIVEGQPLTLTANGVSDPGASGVAVTFYEESNNIPGLQTGTGGDFAFTAVTNGGTSISLDTTNAIGTFTIYAQVTDSAGGATATGTAAPTITISVIAASDAVPTVAAITASPNPIVSGDTLTLTASGVSDPGATVSRVYFYEETNGIPGLQTGPDGDFAFRPSRGGSGGFSLNLDTTGVTGALTFYALAVDDAGNTSAVGTDAPSVSVSIASDAVPDAPTDLTGAAVSASTIDLSYAEDDSGQTGFTIQRALNPGFTSFTQLFTINRPDVLAYTDTNLAPNTHYYYRVEAFDLAGDSEFSNVASIATPAPATRLIITKQPASAVAGAALNDLVIELESANGKLASADNTAVTLTLASAPKGASLGGLTTVQAVNGIAIFTGLTLTTAGHYTLLASDGDLTTARTKSFTITADAAASHLVLTQTPAPALVGKDLSPLVIELQDPYGNLITTRSSKVTVSITSGPAGGALKGPTSGTLAGGILKLKTLQLTESGAYTLQVTDPKVSSLTPVTFAQTVVAGTTTIPAPHRITVKAGKTIPISVHLTSTAGSSIPFTGTLTLLDQNGNTLGTAALTKTGTAKFLLTNLAAGTYLCTITYPGDTNHRAATSAAFSITIA